MKFYFIKKGRLGNAIFRYMACAYLCIKYNGEYSADIDTNNLIGINDVIFIEIIKNNLQLEDNNYILLDFFQHDTIYKLYKKDIINFIKKNDHIVYVDGNDMESINGIKMKNIIKNTGKVYDFVFHIRLGDRVNMDGIIKIDKLETLIDNMNINDMEDFNEIVIVCDKLNTDYEKEFVERIKNKLFYKFNKKIIFENNSILEDYHIMKNAKILICSNSTLSWTAAFFSENIKKCYMPYHKSHPLLSNTNCSFYFPIENTELYNVL